MNRLLIWFRSHILHVGFAAALVPVALLLCMQWVWLTELERASAIAEQAALRNALESVGDAIEYHYRSTAERLLNLPPSLLQEKNINKIAKFWQTKSQEGVERLFVVDYSRSPTGNFLVYNPEACEMTPTFATDESLAIVLAALPWQARLLDMEQAKIAVPQVNENDPNHRIIIKPIDGAEGHLVGLAGMIVDNAFFRAELLPRTVEETLSDCLCSEHQDDLVVSVEDEQGVLAFGRTAAPGTKPSAAHRFGFVFKDWTVRATRLSESSGLLANTAFTFNMTLSVILATVLLAGLALALAAANKAVRLSVMKSDFVSNVSHELRTPLASIRVFGELLRLGKTDNADKVREYGEYIETESRRLSRLIDNILDFSRIESRQKVYCFRPTDAVELVRQVVHSFAVRIERAGFTIVLDLPQEPGPRVHLDADAISQVLHNLIDNAVKYSEPPATITVSLRHVGESIVVAVRDQGVGIERCDHDKIFDRFHRVCTGLVHDVKGSGLGLAIVDHVAKAHHGIVTVESEPGAGSVFTLLLPSCCPDFMAQANRATADVLGT